MKRNEDRSTIFIVVKVYHGIPVVADAFIDESAAEQRAKELKVDMNPEYDEVEIFQTELQQCNPYIQPSISKKYYGINVRIKLLSMKSM